MLAMMVTILILHVVMVITMPNDHLKMLMMPMKTPSAAFKMSMKKLMQMMIYHDISILSLMMMIITRFTLRAPPSVVLAPSAE